MKATVWANVVNIELTRRNLQALLDKLDDPLSARTLYKYADNTQAMVSVSAVEDEEHYADREPGAVYMPSTGETR